MLGDLWKVFISQSGDNVSYFIRAIVCGILALALTAMMFSITSGKNRFAFSIIIFSIPLVLPFS